MGRQSHHSPCVGRPVSCALLVCPQPCQLGVSALADVALVGPLARVEAHVVAQGGGLTETSVAKTTHEGLVQRVDAHVGTQVTAGVEAPVADDTAHATGCGEVGGADAFAQAEVICEE